MIDSLLRVGALWVLAASVGILVIAVLRPIVRRYVGARGVLLLWWILPVALLAVGLPKEVEVVLPDEPVLVWNNSAARPAPAVVEAAPVAVTNVQPAVRMSIDWHLVLFASWLAGALVLAIRFAFAQRRFVRTIDWRTGKHGTLPADGMPAVVGAFAPRIALPADFRTRYSAAERRLILLHEVVHLHRRDGLANFAMTTLRVLMWFNPLVHWAGRALGDDQESACDATVIARHPDALRTYADALLRSEVRGAPLPLVCHWQAYHPTVKRIAMLKEHRSGGRRTLLARLMLACGVFFAVASVYALQPVREVFVAPPEVEVKTGAAEPLPFIQPVASQRMRSLSANAYAPIVMAAAEPAVASTPLNDGNARTPGDTVHYPLGKGGAITLDRLVSPSPASEVGNQFSYVLSSTIAFDGTTIASPIGIVPSDRPMEIEQSGVPNVPNFRVRMTPSPQADGRIMVQSEFTISEGGPQELKTGQPRQFGLLVQPGERAVTTMRRSNGISLVWTVVAWPIPRFVQMQEKDGVEKKIGLSDAFRCEVDKGSYLGVLMQMLGDDIRISAVHGSGNGALRLVGVAPSNARVVQLMRELSVSSHFEQAKLLEVRRNDSQGSSFQLEFVLKCGDKLAQELQRGATTMTMLQLLQANVPMSINIRDRKLMSVLEAIGTAQKVGFTSYQPIPDHEVTLRKHDVPRGPLLYAVLQCSGLTLASKEGGSTRQYIVSPLATPSPLPLQECVDQKLPDGPARTNMPTAS